MRKSKKLTGILLLSLFFTLTLQGCGKGQKASTTEKNIYYLNTEDMELVTESYDVKKLSTIDKVSEVLSELENVPDSSEYKSVFPKGVKVEDFVLQDKKLSIYFNTHYANIQKAEEVLLRGAVVQTLVQFRGVECVEFFVGDTPLVNRTGSPVGYMRSEDFVQNTGSSLQTYQSANVQLYFANKKGDKLAEEEFSLRYNSNMSIEKLVVEKLIKGPSGQKLKPTIPQGSKLLGVSIKDSICYVNFDDGFLSTDIGIAPELSVYSIVNSIIESGTATQVQISVNGETDVKVQGSFDLSKPFSQNLDIVEETKK